MFLTYSFLVTNTGDAPLTNIAFINPQGIPWTITCPATDLAVGASEVCTTSATRTIVQADLDTMDGVVIASATATADYLIGGVPWGTISGSQTLDMGAQPPLSLSVAKSAVVSPASDQNAVKAGDTVTYSFLITNTGQGTLHGVRISDPNLTVTCPDLDQGQ